MITTANIYKTIKERLSADFVDITNSIKDIKTPIAPCFYVQYIGGNDEETANETINTTCSFNIVYFSETETLLDLTEIETRLRACFKKPLKVFYKTGEVDCYKFLTPEQIAINFNETDYILNCMINFEFLQNDDIENPYDEEINSENMDILELS